MKIDFPENFLWGASTSSHQVEGHNENNWSVWEKKNAMRLASNAKKPFGYINTVLREEKWEGLTEQANLEENYVSGSAVEHLKYFKQDVNLMKNLHFNAYRFSIEWSKIEPEKGYFNQDIMNMYIENIKYLKQNGIEPFVTLWHWTFPLWVEKEGGVHGRNFVKYFDRFASYIGENIKDDVKFLVTLNEPEVYLSMGYIGNVWPPQDTNPFHLISAFANLIWSHRQAYKSLKSINQDFQISIAKHNAYYELGDKSPISKLHKFVMDLISKDAFLFFLKDRLDYFGLNHYGRGLIQGFKIVNQNEKLSDMGWELCPSAMYETLMEIKRYKIPVYITENGLADAKDIHRTWFIKETLKSVHKAIADGVDVRGYLHWSLLDNFEWDKGFWPKFGLISVDRENMKRTVRESAKEYAEIISNNGFEVSE